MEGSPFNRTAKRALLSSIQQSSVTHADGYRTMPLRTGYERVILSRVNEDFGLVAEQDGEVVEITETSLMIRYKDGSEHAFDLGRRFGQAAGAVYPHELKSNVKPGQKFKAGHALFYNAQYFEPDPLDSSVVVWKSGVPCRVAFLESPETHEDASSISQSLAEKLNTQITKVRDITVSFDQSVHRLVEVGDRVEVDSILCSIEDAITAGTGLFDETSLDTLKLISANAPKAKMRGVVEKVEVFYHGEFDDMSESLQQLARRSDLLRKRQAKRTMRNYTSGRVDGALRIKGNPLAFGNAVIRIHISGDVGASSGDKFVLANQLKSIVASVMPGRNETESGEPIDMLFSWSGVERRMVYSPVVQGMANVLLRLISERAVSAYRKSQ